MSKHKFNIIPYRPELVNELKNLEKTQPRQKDIFGNTLAVNSFTELILIGRNRLIGILLISIANN